MKRRRQNQKFPSFQIFRLAAGGVGGAANKKCGKFLGFAPRELAERGRGAVLSFVQNGFEQSYIIPPISNFPIFCRLIQPREARKDEEKQGRRAGRGSPSGGSSQRFLWQQPFSPKGCYPLRF